MKRFFSKKGESSGAGGKSMGRKSKSKSQDSDSGGPDGMLSLFRPKVSGVLEAGNDMDRVLYEMPMPQNVDAMTDLIKLHKVGDKFPYVGIVGNEEEQLDSRRARLLALKPDYGIRNIPEIEVTDCPLFSTEGEFSMSDLIAYAKISQTPVQPQTGPMPKSMVPKDYSITKRYVHVRSITGLYVPTMSSTADYCKFWIQLVDTRLVNTSKAGQSAAIVSNQEGVVELSCDYYVSTKELSSFTLSYTLEREIVKPGFQWGTLTFYFNLTESDVPQLSTKRTALAVYRMPISTLADRNVSADKTDISFTPSNLGEMRGMYMRGDIVDVDAPQTMRLKKSSYASTNLRKQPKGEEIGTTSDVNKEWDYVKNGRKPLVDAAEASISARTGDDDEDSPQDATYRIAQRNAWKKEQEMRRETLRGGNEGGSEVIEPESQGPRLQESSGWAVEQERLRVEQEREKNMKQGSPENIASLRNLMGVDTDAYQKASDEAKDWNPINRKGKGKMLESTGPLGESGGGTTEHRPLASLQKSVNFDTGVQNLPSF